jgi:uncharacterized protein (DUF2252 family)
VATKTDAPPAAGKGKKSAKLTATAGDVPDALRRRFDVGRAERRRVPLETHAAWSPPDGRGDPIAVIEEQNRTRVPELVPVRHGRMIVSPFAFYRGTAGIMAADLPSVPLTGLVVQCCGDAHLSNFGVFAAPDRRLVFDLNDFDETLPAPFELDVKRLAASLVVAGRGNDHKPKTQRAAARACAQSYRTVMAKLARMRFLDVWYARVDPEEVLQQLTTKAGRKATERSLAKARSRTNLGALEKLAERVDGGYRIREQPPIVMRPAEGEAEALEGLVLQALRDYALTMTPDRRIVLDRYRLEDFARKVVGVGSVGTEALMLLLMGDSGDDPLFLQVKEARPSVLAPHVGPSVYEHQGERVVQGQRLMQSASDAFLGWVTGAGAAHREFYVRQLRDMKGSASVDTMAPHVLARYGELCAATLARSHARTGDAAAISGYLGEDESFDAAIERFAVSYADQNDADYAAFVEAAESGRLAVERGV